MVSVGVADCVLIIGADCADCALIIGRIADMLPPCLVSETEGVLGSSLPLQQIILPMSSLLGHLNLDSVAQKRDSSTSPMIIATMNNPQSIHTRIWSNTE